jgi:hypothetical protein
MRKLSVALVAAFACVACVLAVSADATPAPTKLSVDSYPGGVFGYVTGSKACSADRKVVVYEQVGQTRQPGTDPRISSDLAEESEARYMWTVATGKSGRFYAAVAAGKGCAAELSGTVESQTVALEAASMNDEYPLCSPSISEGIGGICRFSELYMEFDQEGPFNPCRFGSSTGNCPGYGYNAPFPWGKNYTGGYTRSQIYWKPDGAKRSVTIVSYYGKSPEGNGAAHLGGTIPTSNSNRFTVTDGFAQNEAGYPNGDHFFTPDLPGQGPGEVGGPLKFSFENGSGLDFGAKAWISGYLYLKH